MDYGKYLPDILKEIEDFAGLGTGFDPETELLRGKMIGVSEECMAETASEEGIARFERLFGLRPGAGDSLEERRVRVMGRFRGLPPYSIGWLREILAADCGEDGFSVSQDPEEFWLRVSVTERQKNYAETLGQRLREQIPAAVVLRMAVLHQPQYTAGMGVILQVGTRWSWEEQENGAV